MSNGTGRFPFPVGVGGRLVLCLGAASALLTPDPAWAREQAAPVRRVRVIDAKLGVASPAHVAYSPRANAFVVLGANGADGLLAADLRVVTLSGEPGSTVRTAATLTDPAAMAFDAKRARLLILEPRRNALVAIPARPDGGFDLKRLVRFDAGQFGLQDPQGATVDPASGRLFVLDGAGPRLVLIEPDEEGSFRTATVSRLELGQLGAVHPRGLAFDPTTRHLHVLVPAQRRLYELTEAGAVVATRSLADLGLVDPCGMTFAPSGDLTDDPRQVSLYVADAGRAFGARTGAGSRPGGIVELSLVAAPTPAAAAFASNLVATTLTSAFVPPSPDPSGICYMPLSGVLRIADGEVDEMPIYAGANVFETTLGGSLLNTANTLAFSSEPVGVTLNPSNQHLFYSDDAQKRVWEINPGPDGLYHTSDDIRTSFSTTLFGSIDPEDLVYDPSAGVLFIIDGLNSEVYRVSPGPNGVFEGVPPSGDDLVTQFDTAVHGITDPEGITLNTDNGNLYMVGQTQSVVAEVTKSGALVQTIDISAASSHKAAGLAYAPGSLDASVKNLYIVDRGVDNNTDPNENDGKMYEMTLFVGPPINTAPVVSAGPNQTITLPSSVTLDGTVSDDGLPNPTLTTTWSQVSGPGTVSFADPSLVDTTASFSVSGMYVLRLSADDSLLSSSDDVTITVNPVGQFTTEVRIGVGVDDAEERPGGTVSRTSTDLELVYTIEGPTAGNGTVGLRFVGVPIPNGVTILNAWVQFETDEVSTGAVTLAIQGEAADNAPGFAFSAFNISSRPRTSASTSWSPPDWTSAGAQGPNQRTSTIAPVIQEIVNRPGWTDGNALVLIVSGADTTNRIALAFEGRPASAPLLHVDYTTGPPPNQAPLVSAGLDQTITFPSSATLDGTVSDDGLPDPPAALTTTWSKVSGPGTVTFGDASAVDTTASFSTTGVYTLQLSADDGFFSIVDGVVIVVNVAGNVPPTVSAGIDQIVTLPASASLDGAVSDDGLPNPPGALTTTWSQVSGPGTAGFADPSAVDTTASFSTNGVYTLRLTANDGAVGIFDDVVITVNAAPTVSAGTDQLITLPASASLDGTVSDDGLPGPLTTTWSKVSGPGSVSFGNANAVDTTATFSTTGGYTLRLTANDGSVAVFDDVVITVNAAPTVSAGNDQTITLPASASLDGSASDDGGPGPLTTTWSKVSGPGTVTFGNANAVDTTASFSFNGIYTLRLTANDGAVSASDDVVITVFNPGGVIAFERRVAANSDDAEEKAGSVSTAGRDLDLGLEGGVSQMVGIRFNGVDVPRGAPIVKAWVQFKADKLDSLAASLLIQGQAANNAPTFAKSTYNILLRPRTAALVNWVPPKWTVVGQVGPAQQTSNLAAVIQEIVNRPGWVAGNSLVLIITGTGHREAEAYDGDQAGAAVLHVEHR